MDGLRASSGPGANDAVESGSRMGRDFKTLHKEFTVWVLQVVDKLSIQFNLMKHRSGPRGRKIAAALAVALALLVVKLMGKRGQRFAQAVVATAYPLYASFKSLEQGSDVAQKQWLAYWMCLGVSGALEAPASVITDLVPSSAALKLSLLVWLQRRGSTLMYALALRPLLKRNEARLDAGVAAATAQVEGVSGELMRRFGSVRSAVEEETKRASLGA